MDHITSSPSINYASLQHLCPIDTVVINGAWYDVQIVLECKQNPVGIVKERVLIQNICKIIPDNEMVWKTNQRASLLPYGLLIRAKNMNVLTNVFLGILLLEKSINLNVRSVYMCVLFLVWTIIAIDFGNKYEVEMNCLMVVVTSKIHE